MKVVPSKPEKKKKQSDLVALYPELDTNGENATVSSRNLRCKYIL